jgi:hypothetical protein
VVLAQELREVVQQHQQHAQRPLTAHKALIRCATTALGCVR